MKYRPSKEDVAIIKRCAAREAELSVNGVLLQPGIRVGENGAQPNMNIALVSRDPDWNDTDLFDHGRWVDFRRGIELTPDGRGIVDFYLYSRDPDSDLLGNVTAYIERGELVRVHGYGNPKVDLWRKA